MAMEMAETTASFSSSVTDYKRIEANMISDLKRVQKYAQELDLVEVVARADEVLMRIENNFFSIAVVGEFKRGKSTLINALLGKEILPSDVLPTTATLNRVTYGLKPSAQLIFKAKNGEAERSVEIAAEQLINYVTKLTPESESVASDIKEAIVYYPVKYCHDKADIIDTPGLNEDATMTEVTLSVLPKVDAAILVILAQAPFAGSEGDFLNRMLINDLGRVIFVVNRIDEIRKPEDRLRIQQTVETRILRAVEEKAAELYGEGSDEYSMFLKRIGRPKVFGVSGQQALDAKMNDDAALLEASGFPKFEEAVEHFLTYDRGAVSLQVLADCTVASCGKVLHKINIQEGALQMQAQEFETAYQANSDKLEELRQKYQEEMRRIDLAAKRALEAASPHLAHLEAEMKKAAEQAIEATEITPADLDKRKQPQTIEKVRKKIAHSVQNAGQLLAEKSQLEIERELQKEIGRLGKFASEVNAALRQIEMEFSPVKTDDLVTGSSVGDLALGSAVDALTVWGAGAAIVGYREAGLKGALVGGAAGFGAGASAVFGAGIVIGLLGLPITWPVLLPVLISGGIASSLTGRWAAQKVGGEERVEKFKANYQQAAFAEIEKQSMSQKTELGQRLERQVADAFDALKRDVQHELGGPIEQTQATLDELRQKIARSEAVQEMELQEMAKMRLETQKIQSKAHAKSKELREITEV